MSYVEPANSTGVVQAIRKNFWNANLAGQAKSHLHECSTICKELYEIFRLFFFFSVNARILLNIFKFHHWKVRALSCVSLTFGPLGGGGVAPPLKPPFTYNHVIENLSFLEESVCVIEATPRYSCSLEVKVCRYCFHWSTVFSLLSKAMGVSDESHICI